MSKGLAANDIAKAKGKERSPDLKGHRDANLICVLFQPQCCVFCLWASSEAAKSSLEFTRGNWKFHHQSTSPEERITDFALKSAFPFPRAGDNCRGEQESGWGEK